MSVNDGGPAFARPLSKISSEEIEVAQEGMSLRDSFAAHALAGYLACFTDENDPQNANVVAERAYEYADALLAAREKAMS